MPIHFCIYKYYNAQDFFKSLIEFINDYTLVLISIPLFLFPYFCFTGSQISQ